MNTRLHTTPETLTPKQVLGRQIRDLRKSRSLTLSELAGKINRSVGWLSQIERGLYDVSITAMHEIATALDVQISWFFQTGAQPPADEVGLIVRKANRRTFDFHGTGAHEEILSPSLNGQFLLIESTFAPGTSTGDRDRQRRGEEAGLVVSGLLELHVDGKTYQLGVGDSFTLTKPGSHRCHNPGLEPTVLLWISAAGSY